MHSESQPDSPTGRNQSTGRWLVLVAALLCLGPTGCHSYRALPDATPAELHGPTLAQRDVEAIADEYLSALLEYAPELGTMYSLPGAPHDRLSDHSPEARAAWQAREDTWLAQLDALGMPTEVGSRDWVTWGILHETLASSAAIRVCRNELWAASSTTGWHTSVPSLFEIQPVDTPELQRQALRRLATLPKYIDIEIANLRRGLESGFSAPRLTVAPAVSEVRALAGADSPLLSPGIRAGDPKFAAEVQALFESEIAPAVERYARFLETEYLPRAREEIGIGYNPDGAKCYPALVRHYATIEPAASEIHRLGLEQIAGIRAEMQDIIDKHFAGATIEAFLQGLNDDPKYTFRTEDEVLQYSVAALARAKARMPEAFGRLPKADVEIRAYPAYRASGTGEYHPSSGGRHAPGCLLHCRRQSDPPAHVRSRSRFCTTKPTRATICRAPSRWNWATACTLSHATSGTPDSARVGRCTRSAWQTSSGCTAARSTAWACCRTRRRVPRDWSSTAAFTPSIGRGNRPWTTC